MHIVALIVRTPQRLLFWKLPYLDYSERVSNLVANPKIWSNHMIRNNFKCFLVKKVEMPNADIVCL